MTCGHTMDDVKELSYQFLRPGDSRVLSNGMPMRSWRFPQILVGDGCGLPEADEAKGLRQLQQQRRIYRPQRRCRWGATPNFPPPASDWPENCDADVERISRGVRECPIESSQFKAGRQPQDPSYEELVRRQPHIQDEAQHCDASW